MAAALTTEQASAGRFVARVAVKVRFSSFFTRTKITKLAAPTTDAAEVQRAALAVLDRFELTPAGAPARRPRRAGPGG